MTTYSHEYIEQLLSKFMDGTTTVAEEDVLAEFFRSSDVPAAWEDYRQMFVCFGEMSGADSHAATRRPLRWHRYAAAAAVAAALVLAATQWPHSSVRQPLAQATAADTVATAPVQPSAGTDTTVVERPARPAQPSPSSPQRRHQRRQTMTAIDKTYAVLAQAKPEPEAVERELEDSEQELLHARMLSLGLVPVRLEDGSINYVSPDNEQDFYAYED